jgi:hypothetical protein
VETELKADSWYRYLLYRREAYTRSVIASDEERKAIEAGQKFALAAYADVWADDAELVERVRRFLHENFHWHERLAKTGSALEVVQTLQDMVRGGSVVVIPEPATPVAGLAWPPRDPAPAVSSFWGVDNYDAALDVPVMERYRAQRLRFEAERTTWSEASSIMDGINERFMRAAVLADPIGTLPVFAKAGWVSKYGLPDLSGYGAAISEANDSVGSNMTSLSEASPFEYRPIEPSGDAFDLAKTPNRGTPGTWYTNPGSGQMRLYGTDGRPAVDLDFDHSHNGLRPHAHNWNGSVRDGANDVVPFSPWSR